MKNAVGREIPEEIIEITGKEPFQGNYYRDDNPANPPLVKWRAHANLFFSNWINYYVYQETPYNIEEIE